MLQRSIPRIRSTVKRAWSQDDATLHAHSISRYESPPPSYKTEDPDPSPDQMQAHPLDSDMASRQPSRPRRSTSARQEEMASGVRWRFALPGFQVLRLAEAEAAAPAGNSPCVRSQYITGTACILKGLPTDLTDAEVLVLRAAIAESFVPAKARDQPLAIRPTCAPQERRSVLHRGVACATLHVLLVAAFLLPYIQQLVRQAYRFDRRHQISDRVFAHSVLVADKMGRGTVTVASQLCALDDGRVRELVKEMGIYIVQGVGGGVYDGIGESLSAFGIRAEPRPNEAPPMLPRSAF